jgi:hypothetical protein
MPILPPNTLLYNPPNLRRKDTEAYCLAGNSRFVAPNGMMIPADGFVPQPMPQHYVHLPMPNVEGQISNGPGETMKDYDGV